MFDVIDTNPAPVVAEAVCTMAMDGNRATAPCVILRQPAGDEGIGAIAIGFPATGAMVGFFGIEDDAGLLVTHLATDSSSAPTPLSTPGRCSATRVKLFCRATLLPGQVLTVEARP